ncbi:MAG: NADH-quinone oxidoreductase subunit [Chloroflexota bacterium]|nr:NADH-quinone oxidoreductase subunit [Chloroflexota bacterium]
MKVKEAPPRADDVSGAAHLENTYVEGLNLVGDTPEGPLMELNMGPQHPSTHGVLRLVLRVEGEVVRYADPDIGYLHTGFEKDFERLTYHQAIPLTDRMDYLSPLGNNLGYALAVEKLLGEQVPDRAERIRVILVELSRIGSHLIFLGTHALDLGAQSAFLYGWREREKILEINEMVSGVRMMTSFIRVGGLMGDVPPEFEPAVRRFAREFRARVDDYEAMLSDNPLWIDRTRDLGVVSADDAIGWGVSGPTLRASGIAHDLRRDNPYSGYEDYEFDIPVGTRGDVYDRYLVRVREMRESIRIVEQAIDRLAPGPVVIDNRKVVLPPRHELDTSMEAVIHHFKLVTEGFRPPAGEVYMGVEGPRGELGFFLVSDATNKPYRLKVRGPSFNLIAAIPHLITGHIVADVVAILGSLDFVLGDSDR